MFYRPFPPFLLKGLALYHLKCFIIYRLYQSFLLGMYIPSPLGLVMHYSSVELVQSFLKKKRKEQKQSSLDKIFAEYSQ